MTEFSCEACNHYNDCEFLKVVTAKFSEFLKKVTDLSYICMKNTTRDNK